MNSNFSVPGPASSHYLLVQQSLVFGACKSAENDHHISGVLRGVVFGIQEVVVGLVTLTDTDAVNVTAEVHWNSETSINCLVL